MASGGEIVVSSPCLRATAPTDGRLSVACQTASYPEACCKETSDHEGQEPRKDRRATSSRPGYGFEFIAAFLGFFMSLGGLEITVEIPPAFAGLDRSIGMVRQAGLCGPCRRGGVTPGMRASASAAVPVCPETSVSMKDALISPAPPYR